MTSPAPPRAVTDPDRLDSLPLAEQRALVDALLERYTAMARSSPASGDGTHDATGDATGDGTHGGPHQGSHRLATTERSYRLNSLQLAKALLEKIEQPSRPELAAEHGVDPAPPHYVILGPTQAGKSSLVNLLLGDDTAEVSALAGFTVHAQGFAIEPPSAAVQASVAAVMAPLHQVTTDALERDALDQYTLESVSPSAEPLLDHGIVWDTPDFDSIESGSYRAAVMHAAALADVLILAMSKDKYADRTVWDVLGLVRQLGKPIVLVINKLEPAEQSTVLDSLRRRYCEVHGDEAPAIVELPLRTRTAESLEPWPATVADALRDALEAAGSARDTAHQQQSARRFMRAHWVRWLEPATRELAAAEQWQTQVDASIIEAVRLYRQRYLDDPHKYDTFNRALAELLNLLEIPGVAATLARTRQWVTWPARTLLGIGRQAIQGERDDTITDQEQQVLDTLCEQVLTRLQGKLITRHDEHPAARAWWQHLDARLRGQRARLNSGFIAAAEQYRRDFEPRIDAAAHKLYSQLQQQPRLLNTLRATRVTTDAAGVALAVKSGGLAPADLVLAPAMLAVTSLLTESALGRYLDGVKRELKQQQAREAAALFDTRLRRPLLALRDSLIDDDALMLDSRLEVLLRAHAGVAGHAGMGGHVGVDWRAGVAGGPDKE